MSASLSERAIILAPRGRDADVAGSMLKEVGIESVKAADLQSLVALLKEDAGFAVITDEALRNADVKPLAKLLTEQPPWSDIPFIMLTMRGGSLEKNPAAARYLELLGNVTFVERPFHPTTLISLARAALRGRRRQYEARSRLISIHDGQRQLRFAMAAGGLGAWSLNVASMELRASTDCKKHFGRGRDDKFGYEDLLASVHPDDLDRMQTAVQAALSSGQDYNIEYRCNWPDGSEHWVQIRGRPQLDANGVAVRMAGVSQDITVRKNAEATMRDFAVELEKRVAERTQEREQVAAQLHEMQKLETLGHLTGGVAHDFNNLLTPIMAALERIQTRGFDDRTPRFVEGALQAAERARILIARLLSFARRQHLAARPTDICGLVNGMVDLIERSIGPMIELNLNLPDNVPPALIDPNQLELALLNLAVNARDAMPNGGKLSLAVRTCLDEDRHDLPSGQYICVVVRDSGPGMDPETLARAVEPFYSTKGVGKGTGLGLSMVHGLAAQSGGKLLLSSESGEGLTAELWLPVAAYAVTSEQEDTGIIPTRSRGLRTLVVDDEEIVRDATVTMLGDLGHDVIEAASGVEAIQLLRTERIDLLVTDYLMPGMSGRELALEARKLKPGLPVLVVTGFAEFAEESAAELNRLAKPFRLSDLARAIETSLTEYEVAERG